MSDANERRVPTVDELIPEARAEAETYRRISGGLNDVAIAFRHGWIRGVKRGIELERERLGVGE